MKEMYIHILKLRTAIECVLIVIGESKKPISMHEGEVSEEF